MPATALRHPEIEADSLDAAFDAPTLFINSAPASSAAPAFRSAPSPTTENVDWREVAPYVERFTGAPSETERRKRRTLRKRHRHFVMSGVFLAGTLLFAELVGLVWLGALDLSAVRYAASLDHDIQKTSLELALAQNQLAASSSPAQLEKWAAPLGYHKAQLPEMDDVTSNARAIAPLEATP